MPAVPDRGDGLSLNDRIEALYRDEASRVLATLIRLLGDFDLAEEALHDAFAAAMKQWPAEGLPDNPRAWLVSTGRFKAIDTLRRQARFRPGGGELAEQLEAAGADPADAETGVADDHLRLIFTCCHPALAADARVALTLRTVCGLTTEEIAHAFLTPVPTVAQRIVRAKARIRDAGIAYEVPSGAELAGRLDSVLVVIYLVFNEGYAASAGDSLTRVDLSAEALRLGRVLMDLMPEEPEVAGLTALMLLHDARRTARSGASGDLVLLEDQDRALWDRSRIADGAALVERALATGRYGPYTLQAAIAALHAEAPDFASTDWVEIVGLYDLLFDGWPSPVVELNRAAAVAMRDGPRAGLELVDAILERGELADYQPAHAARADLCRRLGRAGEAREAYRRALELTAQAPQRRFIQRRLADLDS